jgi:antitoxin YefM
MTTISYSKVRENLAEVWDEVENSREEVILRRRGHEDLALLPAHELRSLQETAHLLRSPANAARLLTALARSRGDSGGLPFASIEALATEAGLSE